MFSPQITYLQAWNGILCASPLTKPKHGNKMDNWVQRLLLCYSSFKIHIPFPTPDHSTVLRMLFSKTLADPRHSANMSCPVIFLSSNIDRPESLSTRGTCRKPNIHLAIGEWQFLPIHTSGHQENTDFRAIGRSANTARAESAYLFQCPLSPYSFFRPFPFTFHTFLFISNYFLNSPIARLMRIANYDSF